MNGGGFAELDAMIARLRAMKDLPRLAAAAAAPYVEKAAKATAAAGTTPTGEPWAPKKKGGGRALVNAAKAVSARAVGPVVQIVLSGIEVWHHKSKTHPRQIIPVGGIPPAILEALKKGARDAFARVAGSP